MTEYQDAVQHPAQAFFDSELKRGSVLLSPLGLPVAMSGGFALTYTVTTPMHKCAVRCFHRDIPSIEKKYELISKKLKSLNSGYFVNFDFQNPGVKVHRNSYPIVKMDWVEGDPLGVWLDKKYSSVADLQKARTQFRAISTFLEKEGMAHGDIQNGNVMMAPAGAKLIDYDGMFVPGMTPGNGSEAGHKHFQHPLRSTSNFGPKMDRFSFIAVDLSLAALIEDKNLHPKFRNGGETIIFTGNDFADPHNSAVFQILLSNPKLKDSARNFAAICEADISAVPTLEDFLSAKNIPAAKARVDIRVPVEPRKVTYISAFPVIDALDFQAAARHVGDKIELIGQIVGVKEDFGRRGRGKNKPYVFINFGHWRGNIVKISIWSEGLAKLKEKPSPNWVGKWVSVTGLLDPPYSSARYGYTHLSVTVQEDGQIQTLDEAQARFRLGKGTAQSASSQKSGASQPRSTSTTKTTGTKPGSGSSNQDILKKFAGGQPKPTPQQPQATYSRAKPYSQPQRPAQQWSLSSVPGWVWVVGFLVLAYWLFGGSNSPKQTRPSSRTSEVPTQTSPRQSDQNRLSRDIARLPDASLKPAPVPAPSPAPVPIPAPNVSPRPQSPAPPTETARTNIPTPAPVVVPNNYLPSPGIPNLSGYDSETRRTIELACVRERTKGPVAYGACLNRQIASLQKK